MLFGILCPSNKGVYNCIRILFWLQIYDVWEHRIMYERKSWNNTVIHVPIFNGCILHYYMSVRCCQNIPFNNNILYNLYYVHVNIYNCILYISLNLVVKLLNLLKSMFFIFSVAQESGCIMDFDINLYYRKCPLSARHVNEIFWKDVKLYAHVARKKLRMIF